MLLLNIYPFGSTPKKENPFEGMSDRKLMAVEEASLEEGALWRLRAGKLLGACFAVTSAMMALTTFLAGFPAVVPLAFFVPGPVAAFYAGRTMGRRRADSLDRYAEAAKTERLKLYPPREFPPPPLSESDLADVFAKGVSGAKISKKLTIAPRPSATQAEMTRVFA